MDSVEAAWDAVLAALARLRAAESTGDAQARIDLVKRHRMLRRQSQYDSLRLIAALDTDGEFAARGVRAAEAVADLERCKPVEARRLVAVAARVFPTTLDGQRLEPVLPATATALGSGEIDLAHAEVIHTALDSPPARRLDPRRWSGAEAQLADWARQYRPDELARLAAQLLDQLDQDGPAPADDEPQVNELSLSRSGDGIGGRIKGRLDSATFEVLALVVRGLVKPEADEHKTLPQRQADALGEMCQQVLDDGRLPVEGGERPHISLVLDYERLKARAHEACLDVGGRISPSELRRLLCDAKIVPVVLGGAGQPLDVGRERRTATLAQRKAVAARDRGCAHPGCHRRPRHCEIHHVTHWIDGGLTAVDELVMLCRVHHQMIHQSGWEIRMRDGRPEFIPPKWLDTSQKPAENHYCPP